MPTYSRLLALLMISALTVPAMAEKLSDQPVTAGTSTLPFANEDMPTAQSDAQPAPAQAPITDSSKMTFTQCNSETRLQKSVLMMAFTQLNPTDTNAGNLYQAGYQLPELLSQQLTARRSAISAQQLNETLPLDSSATQLALQTQRLGSNYRSQLVVSGEIVDMAMAQPNATYNPGLYTRFVNGFFDTLGAKNHFDKRERMFSFQVHIRDSFTGQPLFSKRYDTYGIWRSTQKVGFGTPLFWKSDYGQQIQGLVKMAADELSEVIQCQPFIAQVNSRPGQMQVTLQSGANNGLHAGDTLALYQLVIQGSDSHYQEHDVRLVNRNAAIELREVYPSHSVGVIDNSGYLNGQFLALIP